MSAPVPTPIRALVVEDSAIQAEFLRRDLVARGMAVRVAVDGRAGLEAVRADPPDIVVSDVTMPVMDGFALCAALKADPATRHLPVVLLTALVEAGDVILGLQAGADAYLTKPYEADRVAETIHRLLAQRHERSEPGDPPLEIEFGGRLHRISACRRQILNLLLSTYGSAVAQNRELARLEESLREMNASLETRVQQRTQALVAEEARSREAETLYRTLFDDLPDAVLLVDPATGVLLESNEAARRLLEYQRDEMSALALASFASPDSPGALEIGVRRAVVAGSSAFACVLRARGGGTREVEATVRLLRVGGRQLAHCILRDVTELRQLRFLASHDALTALANRTLLLEQLEQALLSAGRRDTRVAVLAIALDRLKVVNESLGHEAGDAILVETARRLLAADPPVHEVARIGGDRFVAVLDGLRRREEALPCVRSLQQALSTPFDWQDTAVQAGCCVGIALYPEDGRDAATLLRNAEFAMQSAVQRGAGSLAHFSEQLDHEAQQRLRQEAELRRALRDDELVPYLQPLVEIPSGRVVGAESLVRWLHPERGAIGPGQFMARIEEMGMLVPVTERVLVRVAAMQQQRQAQGSPCVPVSVNVSPLHFGQGDLLAMLRDVLAGTGVDPALLKLEITESALMGDPARASRTLQDIRALGIQAILLDDFGTGYSSLAYLKDLPVDMLKIDMSFVQQSLSDVKTAAITTSVIAMAHRLGLAVIGEGVETAAQFEFLRRNRCDIGQGYLFGAPMPAVEFHDLIDRGGGRLAMPETSQQQSPSVLFVGDGEAALDPVAGVLSTLLPPAVQLHRAGSVDEAIAMLTGHNVVAVVCHDGRDDGRGGEVLRRAQCLYPDVLRVLASDEPASPAFEHACARGIVDLGFRLPSDLARMAGVLGDALARAGSRLH